MKEKRPDISRIAPSFLDKVNKEAKIFIEKSILEFKKNQKRGGRAGPGQDLGRTWAGPAASFWIFRVFTGLVLH